MISPYSSQTKLEQSVVSSQLHTHRTSNQPHPPSIKTSPLQPSYNMSSRPNPLTPSPSNLSHHQHISPHRHLPHCIHAGSGNPTAQKTYIKHFTYRQLQTSLSPSIHSENELFSTRDNCFFHRITNWTLTNQVSDMDIQLRLHYCQSLKPWGLQKLIPNHQLSFCWIYLLLLTLSIIRSSCPPSHHWASLGYHFTGLNPISLVGLSGWPGEGRHPEHINWSLGFLRDQSSDPSSSPHTLHHWVPSYRCMASPTIATPMTHSSISLFNQMIQR